MSKRTIANTCITVFVIIWSVVFHYESIRHFYLNPLFKTELPKVKYLFPPAGWIMFYHVGSQFGYIEVFGVKNNKLQSIDPHDIFRTRTIMYDNIHRNILSVAASKHVAKDFCEFLDWRFPYFDQFIVTAIYYPDVTKNYFKRYQEIKYKCSGQGEDGDH